jgi:CcmD family protein
MPLHRLPVLKILSALIVSGLCVATNVIVALAQPPATGAAQEGFVPIDQLKPREELPAAPLVMAAYAVAWLVVFAYVWSLWKRLQKVEGEIADVARRVSSEGPRR